MAILGTAQVGIGLARAYVQWAVVQLFRKLTGRQHPLGWSPEEERFVTLARVGLSTAPIDTIRSLQLKLIDRNPVTGLELSCVPAKTFQTPGFRDSWWIGLDPDSQPKNPKANIVMMFVHGGAFRAGHPLLYRTAYKTWLQRLADLGIQAKIFAVGYPLAPENRFPVPVQGVVEAYQWLVTQQGGSSDNIIFAGDSAGGNLVLTSLEYMRIMTTLEGMCNPAAQASLTPTRRTAPAAATFQPPLAAIAISPATDFRLTAPSNRAPYTPYDILTPKTFSEVRKLYLPKEWIPDHLGNMLLSPVCCNDFGGLVQKKLLVIAGDSELLFGDINEFVDKVKSSPGGLAVQYHVERQQPHCYCVLGLKDLCDRGADVIVPFIAKVLGVQH